MSVRKNRCPATTALLSGDRAWPRCDDTGRRVASDENDDLGDDELYVAVAGKDLTPIAAEIRTIADANAALTDYHRGRRRELATE